jgi:hypothetical protein
VAKQGFDALMAGETKVLGGSVMSKTQAVVNSVLPDKLKAKGHAKMAEPGSAGSAVDGGVRGLALPLRDPADLDPAGRAGRRRARRGDR